MDGSLVAVGTADESLTGRGAQLVRRRPAFARPRDDADAQSPAVWLVPGQYQVARLGRCGVRAVEVGISRAMSPHPSFEDLDEVLECEVDTGHDEFADVITARRQPVSMLLKHGMDLSRQGFES
ncbi:hypothetical protein ACIHFD_23915 [Nonomuraea sp. NPDC051941]|uniref:hypothetical protein n=1 Tax=Nonomuraea sp. NPDC051941 TaxID=3364373 RepID=UPI0037CB5EB7